MTSIISCHNLYKSFTQLSTAVPILDNINITIRPKESLAIMGSSGSGKSTLLSLLGGLDQPTSGTIYIDKSNLSCCTEKELSYIRNHKIGFVYQMHHLLPEFSALENVAIPLLIGGSQKKTAYTKAQQILEKVSLADRLHHYPAQLSGGQRQRVAIARALVNEPACVLMDEPTGNLDRHTAATIHKLIAELNQKHNTSFIVATHDQHLADTLHTTLYLQGGNLVA